MKKILFINDYVSGGGVEKVMSDLINHLPKNEYDITVGAMIKNDDYTKLYSNDIHFLKISSDFDNLINNTNIIAKIINKLFRKYSIKKQQKWVNNEYDIVVAFKEGDCMKWVSNLDKPKKLSWIHVDYSVFHWTGTLFKNNKESEIKCMEKFDKIVCVSKGVKDGVNQVLGDISNLEVCYNPIDSEQIIRKANETIEDLVKPKDKLLFVTVGRLTNQKGYDRLLEICSILNKENYNYELWIIGEGEDYKQLQSMIQNNKLENVKLLGVRKNPYKYMKQADWFICSSYFEGFSTVLQEATVLGIPILTTDCAGAKELLGNNEYGIIVNNDFESLKNGMRDLFVKDDLLNYYQNKVIQRQGFIDLKLRVKKIIDLF